MNRPAIRASSNCPKKCAGKTGGAELISTAPREGGGFLLCMERASVQLLIRAVAVAVGVATVSTPGAQALPGDAGNLNEWTELVCLPGTFEGGNGGGPVQPHATWRGGCLAREDTSQPIFIGKYTSRSDAVYDVTHMSGYYHSAHVDGYTAAAQMQDGTGIVFTAPSVPKPGPVPANVLYPLTTFGFQVQGILAIPQQE
jgi:hypothetical protein